MPLLIDREHHEIEVKRLLTGEVYRETYDALVLSPGAIPIRPALPGIDLPGIFALRTIPDSRRIRLWIEEQQVERAVIIGGDLVGLEMAENLAIRGISVTVVEMLDQVLPPLDPEMAEPIQTHLSQSGVSLHLSDALAGLERSSTGNLVVKTNSGSRLPADLVILSIGVRPEIKLAKEAGLTIGERGGIRVDEQMHTSNPSIWAVGDAVETRNLVTGEWAVVPLAGPANRQGRVAADSICGEDPIFRGVQGTAVCGFFGLTVATTGANEKTLRRLGITGYQKAYLHPAKHAAYYPGASPIHMKVLFAVDGGRIWGAQAVGQEGVAKWIDIMAMAIQNGASVFDLEEAELCYAPQFGAGKDPVNMAGMIASNVLRGDVSLAEWEMVSRTEALLVDVREPEEFAAGHIADAINLPLSELRSRLEELPRDREIWLNCGVGQRAYYATRLLLQHGFAAKNLSGGFTTYKHFGARLVTAVGVS